MRYTRHAINYKLIMTLFGVLQKISAAPSSPAVFDVDGKSDILKNTTLYSLSSVKVHHSVRPLSSSDRG